MEFMGSLGTGQNLLLGGLVLRRVFILGVYANLIEDFRERLFITTPNHNFRTPLLVVNDLLGGGVKNSTPYSLILIGPLVTNYFILSNYIETLQEIK